MRFAARTVLLAAVFGAVAALGELPLWIRNIDASTALEGVFFRMMSLPNGAVGFRRPPRETRPALADLIRSQPRNAELYSLRAMEDEQQLDFTAAESDWQAYADNSSDKISAQLALADFYHRRLRPADEIKTLALVADAAPIAAEKLTAPTQQHSWQAFERIFGVIQAQGLTKDASIAQYRAWIARYPDEPLLYARFLQFLVAEKEYSAAGDLIASYRKQFPIDQIFPVKAKAMVEYRRSSVREGLSVYEQSFQPLWDPQLVKSYFDLLRDTQNLRKFRDDAHAALLANPEDLNATARTFYYYQQQGQTEVAQQAIADFRLHKEAAKSPWTSQELYVCAHLLEDIHSYPESARYYFALYNSNGMADAQEKAIAGLTSLLLTAPETPIRLGSGELSMYRDIATMDQGPGYLNGILSLILNTTQPASRYSEEEQRAVPYFHRSHAAELLALLDSKFPSSTERPALHAQLLDYYATSGESDAVIQGGRDFLASFPNASERTTVALLMADAYARKGDTKNEFAIYDSVLQELAAKAQNVPLGSAEGAWDSANNYTPPATNTNEMNAPESAGDEGAEAGEGEEAETADQNAAPRHRASESFQVNATDRPTQTTGARSPEYARVLERYLARLVEMKQIPPALGVLRREIDRNPDDPGLYERLAGFLDQNKLGTEQEEVYRRAIARFSDKSWYHKLARYYLRYKRDSEFEQLTRDAVKSFQGSDLERYFHNVVYGSPALFLRLNQYAHQRFPHNPVFVRNLLSAYNTPATHDPAAWEALLRQHWFEEPTLRNEFFEYLSRTGKLDSELGAIRQSAPDAASWDKNPAAADFLAYANLWRSHFEESAPVLKSVAAQYPAELEIGRTASSVFRSLAYFEPADTTIAAKIEDTLLQANPTNTEIMARIGDIYAEHEQFAQAAPYWERIPQVAPGQSGGYLEAATIYWDYFDFDNAMRLLGKGRDRLANPSLYAYEAGAVYENQRDYPHAIDEYVNGALSGAPESSAELRLLELARRPKFRDLVDQSTAKLAPLPNPSMPTVYLRVKVLEAQNRKEEVAAFLDSIANATASIEQAEDIETLAQQKSLEHVRQHALEKQAALTTDPVTRLQLRYQLIRLYEGRKDFIAAQKNVEALYHDNPKIFGVVRSTVDFYWRMKMQPQAIAVLLQAAKDAYPALSTQFTYEAARKETDAKQFQQARDLLTGLLKDSPYSGEYLAAMADTYAQAGDDKGLEQFYLDKIALFRNAPLPADARKAQIATLRRGLIPALTRMNNYSGAIDQYIELINNFPEDDTLVTEAALYALRYQRQQQLIDFYAKTVAQSPRDYRWSMVLARTQTNLENYAAAIDTYAKSIAIRPDRADLYIARAGLEERLMRFDEAGADYERIYQLAYKDPQWMEKVATVRARQGKTKEVVAALQAALIEGRPENASSYLELARRLENWGMLDEARSFAEQGVNKAGTDLLASTEHHAGVRIYVRIMTRLRQHEQAYATLQKALADSTATLPVLKEQIEKEGVTGMTDAKWRENQRRTRIETARNGMAGALQELGSTVNTYFTPEERLTFAHFAESKRVGMNAADLEKFAIPLAESAALADQEAHWRFDPIMQQAALPSFYSNVRPFIDLQRRRGRFADLASQMEQFARAVPPTQQARRCSPLPMPIVPPATSKTNFASYPISRTVASTLPAYSVTSSCCWRASRRNSSASPQIGIALTVNRRRTISSRTVAPNSRTRSCKRADKLVRLSGPSRTTLLSASTSPSPRRTSTTPSSPRSATIRSVCASPSPSIARSNSPATSGITTARATANTSACRSSAILTISCLRFLRQARRALPDTSPSPTTTLVRVTPSTLSPNTSTRSSSLPTAPTCTTAWPSPTTSKATAPLPWRSGSRRSPHCRSSSTASGYLRVSGKTSDVPAINSARGISSQNSRPMRMRSFVRISAATATTARTPCCNPPTPPSATQCLRPFGCSTSPPPRRIPRTSWLMLPMLPGSRWRSAPRSISAFCSSRKTRSESTPASSVNMPSRIWLSGRCAGFATWFASSSTRLPPPRLLGSPKRLAMRKQPRWSRSICGWPRSLERSTRCSPSIVPSRKPRPRRRSCAMPPASCLRLAISNRRARFSNSSSPTRSKATTWSPPTSSAWPKSASLRATLPAHSTSCAAWSWWSAIHSKISTPRLPCWKKTATTWKPSNSLISL